MSRFVSVPSNAQVSASVATDAFGQTLITLPAGDMFLDELLANLQTQLNNNIQGYPRDLEAVAAVIGGTWVTASQAAIYLCDQTAGNLSATDFVGGSATLTPSGTPLYSLPGPKGGIDLAVGFDSATDAFLGGTGTFDAASGDLIIAGVFHFDSLGSYDLVDKGYTGGGGAPGYLLALETSTGDASIAFYVSDGVDVVRCSTGIGIATNTWYAVIAVLERGVNQARIAAVPIAGGSMLIQSALSTTAVGSLTNGSVFTFGGTGIYGAGATKVSALFVSKGTLVAAGLSAGLSTALTNFAAMINASWSVTQSDTTGQVTINYSAPPAGAPSFALDWTSTTPRDLLGFTYDLNYADTAAELAAQIGYGTYSSAWKFNSGVPFSDLFGGITLNHTFGTAPTTNKLGPRGGVDASFSMPSGASCIVRAGDVYDVPATDDLIIVWVARHTANLGAAARVFLSKDNTGTNRWFVAYDNAGAGGTTPRVYFQVGDGTDFAETSRIDVPLNKWYVAIAALDRGAAKIRVGIRTLDGLTAGLSTEASASSVDAISGGGFFSIGSGLGVDAVDNADFAYLGVGVGAGYAAGVTANLSTALTNFAATFGAWTGRPSRASVGAYSRMMRALLPPGRALG